MVNDDELKKFLQAARVTSSLREFIPDLVKPGKTFLEVADAVEKEIYSAGAAPAFPVNVSLNDIAAHYTPKINDASVFTEKDVAKIDFGVHVDGFIIDNAITLDLSGHHATLVEAAEQALENALAAIKPGVSNKEVGEIVQETIAKKGFKPIENLCGHSIEQYALHAGVEVPNVPKGNYIFQEGDVFAVEPFATTGSGRITEGAFCEIYAVANPKNIRHPTTRAVLEYALEHYQTLPFAKRWLAKQFTETSIDLALADLQRQGIIESFPVLKEINAGLVSQAEATIIIEKDGVKILG